ncbi:DinB family protein [Paenibacillus sp. HN-1]|uniref:DinB family protein n=1 Tax=Paenibacillus TaxID=44249 RepID=UPI001CA93923|nr:MULTISPECIES: DinB family protein [Paenibacillus]MBY9081296.1 DinB family protein [Paenibacillus sp. CGMCC 1.18879]MBY9087569.1 DinB family protein [Paenibacillus sinensis]
MKDYLFDQLSFIRQATLHITQDITESQADVIPERFHNNIRWNLGHIYLVQEQFAFHYSGEPLQIPDGYRELFGVGTRPTGQKPSMPALTELRQRLKEQPDRIRDRLSGRLDEVVKNPLTIHSLALTTVREYLTLNLYHEGQHVQAIRSITKLTEAVAR